MENFDVAQYIENRACTGDQLLKKVKEFQTHEIHRNRRVFSEFYHLFPILKRYGDNFQKYVRLDINTFNYVLSKVNDCLEKNWCNFHKEPIIPEEKLVITLRFLASGASYTDLSFSFRIGVSTVCTLVGEVMQVLWEKLCPLHMPIPTEEKFFDIAQEFYLKWDLPHCVGAIDGCHLMIKKPPNSGTLYFNYKKYHSIVLQGVVDACYKFISIDVGGYGSQHDSTTFKNSSFYVALKNKTIKLPEDDELPKSHIILPYYFVADGAYSISESLMKPYPGKNLPADERTFNYRLSRARVFVECVFGQLKERWRIFYTKIEQLPDKVELMIKAACILHNVAIDVGGTEAPFEEDIVEDVLVVEEQDPANECMVATNGVEVRKKLKQYLIENPIK